MTKVPQKPELPKPRDFFPPMGPRWLKIEPSRLALLSALFFSTLVMLFYFARQLFGTPMAPDNIVLGVARTFLVSYAGTGFFVWYLLRIAERELPHALKKAPPHIHHHEEEHEEEIHWDEHGHAPEEPEEHS